MSTIDKLLELLQDGGWHNLNEVAQQVGLSSVNVETVVSFLTEYGFVMLNEDSKEIKLQTATQNFFVELQRLSQ